MADPDSQLSPSQSPPPGRSLAEPVVDATDVAQVLRALALAWTPRQRNWLISMLRSVGVLTHDGRTFGQPEVDACLRILLRQDEISRSEAGWQLLVKTRAERYRDAVIGPDFERWRDALMHSEGVRSDRTVVYFQRDNQAITLARLIVYGGGTLEQWRALEAGFVGIGSLAAILDQVALSGFDAALFDRADRTLAAALLGLALHVGLRDLDPVVIEPFGYACRWVERAGAQAPPALRARVIERLLMMGDLQGAEHLLGGAVGPEFPALRAVALATRGQWDAAAAAFDKVFADHKAGAAGQSAPAGGGAGGAGNASPATAAASGSATGGAGGGGGPGGAASSAAGAATASGPGRRGPGIELLRWLYPMCLFASRDVQRIAQARRFALNESGSRKSDGNSLWGLWAQAAEMRLGDRTRDPDFASFNGWHASHLQIGLVPRRMLQAWAAAGHAALPNPGSSQALRQRLGQCGLVWLQQQVEAADEVLSGRAPSTPFFASGGNDSWREALAAIAALHTDPSTEPGAGASIDTRLLWVLTTDEHQRLVGIDPYEQKRGARGWGRPKAASLTKLSRSTTLDPHDARVARAIKPDRTFGSNRPLVDLMVAAPALVGHPRIVFSDDLDHPVALVESLPDLRLIEDGDSWTFRFEPDLGIAFQPKAMPDGWSEGLEPGSGRRDAALRTQFVLRDHSDPRQPRARLVRLTPAHRRVVELAQAGLKVPRSAGVEMQSVLPVLSAHFRLQAASIQGATDVAPNSRLRAEMARRGTSVVLRLVASPLGLGGPRLPPGHGREDVLAMVDGHMRGTHRDLAAERGALQAVVDRFEFLTPPGDDEVDGAVIPEWTVEDPQQALTLVECLPQLDQIEGIDWPSGQSVRVLPAVRGIKVRVRAEGHWFTVDGELKTDDGQVLELARLIEWVGTQRSRFVPIGENTYVALTDSLRQRIEELAVVAERGRGRRGAASESAGPLRIPTAAAQWLDQALADEDTERDADRAFLERVDRLRQAEAASIDIPSGLQAELRPYQLEGFQWMMRRARAGVGVCLADDMGLGKTLQALTVALARAADGPTLVVAPTSVCANWVAEAGRFAPSLRAVQYTREMLGDRGLPDQPRDLLVVSYTLLQQAEEHFAAVPWGTLIVDEAQAIKNAGAKRSRAVARLRAGFRLALSGTPIENRLSELWSLMNVINPGLLGTSEKFAERFVVPIERARDLRAQRILRRLIGPYVLRRIKAQVLDDLPPRTEVTVDVTPAPEEAAHYEALRRDAMTAAAEATAAGASANPQGRFHVLAQLTRLRRAACDPRLVNPELGIAGAKVARFIELVGELVANRHKALVFSQFVDFLQLLRESIDAAGIRYQYLDGSTPAADRERRVNAFQDGDGDLFLISLKAGGFGLNLTAADYVIIVDPWWNPAAEDQAMGRAHRIGQERPVTVYRLVTQGTIEQRIVDLHRDKRALADGILEDIDSSAAPELDELMELLGS